MTHEETLKSLTAKIKKVIPEIDTRRSVWNEEVYGFRCGCQATEEKITLEDVLIYLEEENDWVVNGFISVSSNGNFYIESPDGRIITSFKWEFNKPLSLQSPDTIKYLDEIIL